MKLTSTSYSQNTFNVALLILRVGMGILLIHHGYDKLIHFSQTKSQFISFLGLGSTVSLSLSIFAEFFCSLLVIFGLFTRLAAIPIVINMTVAVWKAHNLDVFGDGEHAALFAVGFLGIALLGAGRYSVDGMVK